MTGAGPVEKIPRMPVPRILVLDDSPQVIGLFELILEPGRFVAEQDASRALARLEAEPDVRIVIADLGMRGGGLPLLRALRARFPGHVILVFSGDASVLTDDLLRELRLFRALEKGSTSLDQLEEAVAAATREAGKG